MKTLLKIFMVIGCLVLMGESVSHMKNRGKNQLSKAESEKLKKSMHMCGRKEKDCSDVLKVLKTITDMISTTTTETSQYTFTQRVQYTETVIIELTHLSEYYELRSLQQNYEINYSVNNDINFWSVFVKTMQKQYEIRTQELISSYFINSYIYAMRIQVYSAIKMVSMIHNFDYTLMSNNFHYDVFTVTRSYFNIAVDYFRLVQTDRLMGKGVMFQISEQIAHAQFNLQFLKDQSHANQELGMQKLNAIFVRYEGEVHEAMKTYDQQFEQIVLLQKIQYQYEQYAKDDSHLLSKDGMKSIARQLSEISFRDNKMFLDYLKTRTESQSNISPKAMYAKTYEEWQEKAYQKKVTRVLVASETYANFEAMEQFLNALLAGDNKTFLWSNAKYYLQKEMDVARKFQSLDLYSKTQTEKIHGSNDFIKSVIGLDNNVVVNIREYMDIIYDFLQGCHEQNVFNEQIKMLHNFGPDADTTENIYNAVVASFVSLKEGYDNYINWAYHFQAVQDKMGDKIKNINEYVEVENLVRKRVAPMQEKLNQKLKLYKQELFNDFISILAEVRNYMKLQQMVIMAMPKEYEGFTAAQQNKMLLDYLNKNYLNDFRRFYERFNFKLNSLFLTQVNIVASVKSFSSILNDELIKIYFVYEKKISTYFRLDSSSKKDNTDKKRLMKKYLKHISKQVTMDPIFLETSESRKRSESDDQKKAPNSNVQLKTIPTNYKPDSIETQEQLTIYYHKIEGSAMYKKQILFTKVRVFNNILMKFLLRKLKPNGNIQQKLLCSPFEDYEKNFEDGIVTRTALYRIDNMMTGANTIEMTQYGNRKSFLAIMELHKCALIRIYTTFQSHLKQYYIQTQITVDMNYQEFILRVRQAYYLYVSDIEVVVVEETLNYYNTINQLKVMGYDEITMSLYGGQVQLLKDLVSYKTSIQDQYKGQLVRVFYCQGCYNRKLVKFDIYSYSSYSYETLIQQIQQQISTLTTNTKLFYSYEINMIISESVNFSQTVTYIVKIYERIQGYSIIMSDKISKTTSVTETQSTTTSISTTKTETTQVVAVTFINAYCVLDSYFSTSKSFSIYDQIITKTEHMTEVYEVQKVITNIQIDGVDFQNWISNINQYFYNDQMTTIISEYELFIKVFDYAFFEFSQIIIKNSIYNKHKTIDININTEGGHDTYFRYYVYVPRKLVYCDFMLIMQYEQFLYEQKQNTYINKIATSSSEVVVYDLACDCRKFVKPDCYFVPEKLKALRDYKFKKEETITFTQKQYLAMNKRLFATDLWKVGQASSWGKLFSKLTNLVLDMTVDSYSFTGQVNQERHSIEKWADYIGLVSHEQAVSQSSEDQGLNLLPLSYFSPLGDGSKYLDVTFFTLTDKLLRFNAMEFPVYYDDYKMSVVVNQMKLAFMFPHKLLVENLLDNAVVSRGQIDNEKKTKMQHSMNAIYADNDQYVIYVGRLDEVIENKEYVRVYIGNTQDSKICMGHQAQVVAKDQVQYYNDIIDPEYIVTEVFYYFEQERQQQYVQDFLAPNYNDPFYKTLTSLGFYPITSTDGDNFSIYGFYDFEVTYNDVPKQQCSSDINGGDKNGGSEFLFNKPNRGMKRIWVRKMQECEDVHSSADIYCHRKQANTGNDNNESALEQAHNSFNVEYKSAKTIFQSHYNVENFDGGAWSYQINTISRILKDTGKTGRDSSISTTSNQNVLPQKTDTVGLGYTNDLMTNVQPYYKFLDAALTSKIDYFADRQMIRQDVDAGKNDFLRTQEGKNNFYRFHSYSDDKQDKHQKYQVTNYNGFSYESTRDDAQKKCYGNPDDDIKNDVYIQEMEKISKKLIAETISGVGECGYIYSYIAYSYQTLIEKYLRIRPYECIENGKRFKKNKKHTSSQKKRRHKKRRTHKKKHTE